MLCRFRVPRAVLAISFISSVGCTSRDLTEATLPPATSGSQLISDGTHSGANAHFFFLPPLVPAPSASGIFDPTLSPAVTVCQISASTCSLIVAQFSMTSGTGSEVVRVDSTNQQYIVNWKTDQCITGQCTLPSTNTYRIKVTVGLAQLGFADVAVVPNASQARNVDTNAYFA